MRVKLVPNGIGAALLLLVTAIPAWAHHSLSADFDPNRPIELKGTVVKVEWVNPHSWFHVDVKRPDGSVERWMIESHPPSSLLRRGLTMNSLRPGTEIVVEGFQAKDRSKKANGQIITFPDGTRLFLGPADTRAPKDGGDPADRK